MNIYHLIAQVASNAKKGLTSIFDAHLLLDLGVQISEDLYQRIAESSTSVNDDVEVWDAAFFSGAI
jgi:hypothetical protein